MSSFSVVLAAFSERVFRDAVLGSFPRGLYAEREALDGVKGGLKGDQVFVLRRFRGISGLFRGQPFCGERKQLAFPTAGHQKAGATIVSAVSLSLKARTHLLNFPPLDAL